MTNFTRYFKINLPKSTSAFLWGARKVGKSTLLRNQFPNSAHLDLLNRENQQIFSKNVSSFQGWVAALPEHQKKLPIIVDEVQKIPGILDDIHSLIESKNLSLLLCGSSARKLKLGQANLLGGRAWRFELHPLCSAELPNLNLLSAFNTGLIPQHYQNTYAKRYLKAYVQDYLSEEIRAEAIVRNFTAFSKFLDAFAFSHGEMCVFQNIASDCGVDGKTVKNYFEILLDTLIAYEIKPYSRNQNRQVIARASKFYLFDLGVAAILQKKSIEVLKGADAGKAFEHFIFLELRAYKSYCEKDFDICYWRRSDGKEIDFICQNGEFAIEVKISSEIRKEELKGLDAFAIDNLCNQYLLVCLEPLERIVKLPVSGKEVRIVPWKIFLGKLWASEYPLN
jgi:uncharacterized protein